MPFIAKIFQLNSWQTISIGNFKLGNFAADLMQWLIIILVTFIFIELFLKKTVATKDDMAKKAYETKYQSNQYKYIMSPDGEDVIIRSH